MAEQQLKQKLKQKETKIKCPISDNMLYFTTSKQYPQPHVLIGIGTPEVRPTRGFVVNMETMKQLVSVLTPEVLTSIQEETASEEVQDNSTEVEIEHSEQVTENVEIKPAKRVAEIRDARTKYIEPRQRLKDSRIKSPTKNLQVVKQEAPSKPKPSPEQQLKVAAPKAKLAAAPAPNPIIQKKLNQTPVDQWGDLDTEDDSVDFPDLPLGDPDYDGEFEE